MNSHQSFWSSLCHLIAWHNWVLGYLQVKWWPIPWWRYQMEAFSALLALCAGISPVNGEFPSQRPVTQSYDVVLDLPLNKGFSKQLRHQWYETQSCSLWRHCNVCVSYTYRTDVRRVGCPWHPQHHTNANQIYHFVIHFTVHRKKKISSVLHQKLKTVDGIYKKQQPFYCYRLTLIPAWMSNHMPCKVWDEILIYSQISTAAQLLKFENG